MKQELEAVFEDQHCSLLKVDEDRFFDINAEMVREAYERRRHVIYVAVEKPYLMLKKKLKEKGISSGRVHFVDAIIKTITNEELVEDDKDKVLYLKKTGELRNISTAILSQARRASSSKKLLIIDSLEALLASHDDDKVKDFLLNIQEMLDTVEMNLVLFDEGREVEDAVGKEIYSMVDNVIFLRGES